MMIQLGYVGIRKGEWQDAISLFTQAQSLVEEKNDPLIMGQIADGLGGVFTESGSPEKGLVQYQRALDYYRKTPDTRAVKKMISVRGNTYYLLGNYPEAEAHLTLALEGSADRLDVAYCNEYLGRVYIETGEYSNALRHLQPALDAYTRAVNPQEAARVQALIG